jgi:hypothetical protein
MIYTYRKAILALYPEIFDRLGIIKTNDTEFDIIQRDRERLDQWIAEKMQTEPMRLLRERRNTLLAQQDWRVIKAITTDIPLTQDWKDYLQALRDLPQHSTPVLLPNGDLDLSSVVWPVSPDAIVVEPPVEPTVTLVEPTVEPTETLTEPTVEPTVTLVEPTE